MNPEQQKIIDNLSKQISDLKDEFYRGNFKSTQEFAKYCRFNNRLKVPHHDTLPSTCEIGEVAETSGKLYVCSAADTWTIVGTQT